MAKAMSKWGFLAKLGYGRDSDGESVVVFAMLIRGRGPDGLIKIEATTVC
jgi:hypothetical protein